MSEEQQAVKWTVSMSPSIGAIAKALAAAQLKMGPAIKDKVGIIPGKDGRQGYQYGYATLAACFEAIVPLHENGIAVTQIPLDGGNGVCVMTLLMHESGEWLRGEMWMPVAQQTPQGHGSAYTYVRRYSLSMLCGLASDDDDGAAATHGPQKPAEQASRPRSGGAGPAKTSGPSNLGLFADICEAIDRCESVARINEVVINTQRAHAQGLLTDSHLEQIKASVAKKRASFASANGGAS